MTPTVQVDLTRREGWVYGSGMNTAPKENTMTTGPKFTVGTAYNTGSHDYCWTFTVVARTAKFVTLRQWGTNDERRVGVKVDRDGGEWALPLGSYSMAPIIRADRVTS